MKVQIPRCRSTKILHHEDFAARHTRSQCPGVETYRKFQLIRILCLCGHSHHQNTAMWNPASSSLTRFDRFAQVLVSYFIFSILFARRYRRDFVLHQIPQLAFPQAWTQLQPLTRCQPMWCPLYCASKRRKVWPEKGLHTWRWRETLEIVIDIHCYICIFLYYIYIYIWIEHLFDIQHMSEEGKTHVRGSPSFTS